MGKTKSPLGILPAYTRPMTRRVRYGWTAAATLGALVIGSIAGLFPARWSRWFWPGWVWVAPILAMTACVYLTIPWFRQ